VRKKKCCCVHVKKLFLDTSGQNSEWLQYGINYSNNTRVVVGYEYGGQNCQTL
jgi:hypothetical protein